MSDREKSMVTPEDLLKDDMYWEAKERMELLNIDSEDIRLLYFGREITKCFVDHEKMRVMRKETSDEEMAMIKEIEKEKEIVIYYLIQDEGMWPDGCKFPRYTLLYVDKNKTEYEFVKTECILECNTIPAYVLNLEERDCSEMTEIGFQNVSGLLINVT